MLKIENNYHPCIIYQYTRSQTVETQ